MDAMEGVVQDFSGAYWYVASGVASFFNVWVLCCNVKRWGYCVLKERPTDKNEINPPNKLT